MFFLPSPDSNGPTNWKRYGLWALLLCVLLTGILLARPAYDGLKRWRAARIALEAEEMAGREEWREAFDKAQAALQLNQEDGKALGLVARILAMDGRSEAFHYWRKKFNGERPAEEELAWMVDLALRLERPDAVEGYLTAELKREPVSVNLLRLCARVCRARGDLERAVQFARATVERDPTDAETKVYLAGILLGKDAGSVEARELLWDVIRSDHELASPALGRLAGLDDLSESEMRECVERLERLPEGDGRDLLLSDLRLRLDPGQRAEVIRAEVEGNGGAGPGERLQLVRWLSRQQEFAKVTELVSVEEAMADKAMFLVYVDALASQDKWEDLELLLSREALPIESVLVELYRARITGERGKDRESREHWEQVHWLASKNLDALRYAAGYAEKLGELEHARRAYRNLSQHRKGEREGWMGLVRVTGQGGDLKEMRSLMRELVARFPQDPAPRNDLAYLDLLAGENLNGARGMAAELVKRFPNFVAYRTTLALAHLRLDERRAAREVFRDVPVKWQEAPPAWRAVYAAVLEANGQREEARKLARDLAKEKLRREERALLEPWFDGRTNQTSRTGPTGRNEG